MVRVTRPILGWKSSDFRILNTKPVLAEALLNRLTGRVQGCSGLGVGVEGRGLRVEGGGVRFEG